MAEIHAFPPVKLVCGVIAGDEGHFTGAEAKLAEIFGPVDGRSGWFPFDFTDYYESLMGGGLRRGFLGFERLVQSDRLSEIKLRTNALEGELAAMWSPGGRPVNLDPGIVTSAALVMATAKNFSHRVPLRDGIYGHLEFLFAKNGIRRLEWTYPDFRDDRYVPFFLEARRIYLRRLKGRS
jgi:hypothetical protein